MAKRYGWNGGSDSGKYQVGQRLRKVRSGLTGDPITDGFEGVVIKRDNWAENGPPHWIYSLKDDNGYVASFGEGVLGAV